MKSILRRAGLLTGSFLVMGLIGCGSGPSTDGANPEPLANETQAKPLTPDPTLGTSLPTVGGVPLAFSDSCPAGYVGTGLNVRSSGNGVVNQIQLACRRLNLDGTLGAAATTAARGGTGGTLFSGTCPNNEIISGQLLGGASVVFQVGAVCSTASQLKNATGGYDGKIYPVGQSSYSLTQCPAGQAVTGIYGHAGKNDLDLVTDLGFKCGKLNDVKSTVDIGLAQISNVHINGSIGPSTTLAAGQNFQLDLNYFIKDSACPGCSDQIIVGLVPSDPAVAPKPLACVYNGYPGASGVSGSNTLPLVAPAQAGTYTFRVAYGQDPGCNLNWWTLYGVPGPNTIIGEFQVY